MQEVDDATLTKFLIRSFSGIFEQHIKSVPKPTIPGSRQHYFKENGLIYLETRSGGLFRYKLDVIVMLEEGNRHIWGMSIFADINEKRLKEIKLHPTELNFFLRNARQIGFLETLDAIGKKEPFCLFEIDDHEEPAPVGANGIPGILKYSETIKDNLASFDGREFVEFLQDGYKKHEILYLAHYIGGRL